MDRPVLGPTIVANAGSNPAISDLLELVATHEHDFSTLYKVYEIVRSEAGPSLWSWTSKKKAERFTATANHRAAGGLSGRHGVSHAQPPKKPMTIEESRRYVLRLANALLQSTVASPGAPEPKT